MKLIPLQEFVENYQKTHGRGAQATLATQSGLARPTIHVMLKAKHRKLFINPSTGQIWERIEKGKNSPLKQHAEHP